MEIILSVDGYDFTDNEQVDQFDRLRRSIFQNCQGIWERNGNGYKITI